MKGWLLASTAMLTVPGAAMAQSVDQAPPTAQTDGSTTPPTIGPDGKPAANSTSRATQTQTSDIIVTAQRRSERLQDVPVAVSVYTANKRDQLGIETVQDVAKYTPGVSFSEFPNRLFIRGVGRFTNQLGSDPGVATYVDGFYTSETTAIGSSPILIDRIEVLRGPQGTLYGRNSIGGAVNIVSQRPTREFTSQVRFIASDYQTLAGAGAVAGPITDWLRFRVTGGAYNQNNGFLKNDAGGTRDYRTQFQLLEGQLEADVGSRGNLWVKYQYYNQNNTPVLNNQIDPYNTTVYFSGSSLVPNPTFGYTTPNPGTSDIFRSRLNYAGYERVRNANQVVVNASYDLGGVVAKYIGGYQSFDYSRSEDYDRSDRASYSFFGQTVSSNLINTITDDKRFFSHEVNLSSDTKGPLRFILGAYYYHEKERQTYSLLSPDQAQLGNVLTPAFTLTPTFVPVFATGAPNPTRAFLNLGARQTSKSYAGYGQVDLKVVPTVTLTGGLRYSRDEKDGFESRRYIIYGPFLGASLSQSFYGAVPTIPASFLPTLGAALDRALVTSSFDVSPALAQRNVSNHWQALSGKAGIAYDPDGNTNFYANYSRGYKSGGYNLYNFTDPVKKETLNAYEVGLKKILPGRFQANLAAFYYDYHNIQIPVSFINVILQQNFVNAPRARSIGTEAELVYSPTDTLQVLVSYSYLDAELRRFSGYLDVTNPMAGNQDLRGNRLPQSPRNKVTGNILNRFDLGGGTSITPVATVTYTSAQYFSPFTTAKYRQGGYTQADFRLVVETADHLQLNAYVRNAFNERSFNGFQLGPESSSFARQVTFNAPRTYGVELIGKF